MKKAFRFLIFAFALSISACGGGNTHSETSGTDTTAGDHTSTDSSVLRTDTLGTVGNDSVQ